MGDTDGRQSNFYDSKYLAEYYDLWVEGYKDSLETQSDAAVYIAELKNGLNSRQNDVSPQHPFRILDVGTGTGRVLLNLANDAEKEGIASANLEMYGVDNEPAMLERASQVAASIPATTKLKQAQWILGEAQTLTESDALAGLQGQIDMLLFAVGSISHLHEEGEPLQFLRQVQKLLRPGQGRAIIPIQDDLVSERSITEVQDQPAGTWSEVTESKDFRSQLYPGVVYRQLPISGTHMDGTTKVDTYSLLVVDGGEAGTAEKVVESNNITIKLRLWKEGEWLQWIEDAGLECERTLHTRFETYYILK